MTWRKPKKKIPVTERNCNENSDASRENPNYNKREVWILLFFYFCPRPQDPDKVKKLFNSPLTDIAQSLFQRPNTHLLLPLLTYLEISLNAVDMYDTFKKW